MEPRIIRAAEGLPLLGGRQTIKLTSEDTNGSSAMILSDVPAGTGIPMHVHKNEDEIFQIIEGEIIVTIGAEEYLLNKDDMIFMPRNIPHGFKATVNTKMWVSLTPGGAEKMFFEIAQLPPGPPDPAMMVKICGRYDITFV